MSAWVMVVPLVVDGSSIATGNATGVPSSAIAPITGVCTPCLGLMSPMGGLPSVGLTHGLRGLRELLVVF